MPGLGDEFRVAREARHLSLADVSDQIHIRAIYLQSIEAEDWSALAAPVYARGFIRTYARFLGLDGERAVAEFGKTLGDAPARSAAPRFETTPRTGRSPWLWLATALAACLVAYVAFYAVRLVQDGRQARRAQAARSVAVAAPAPSPAVAASLPANRSTIAAPKPSRTVAGTARTTARTLEIVLTQRSWLAVSVDGTQTLVGIFPAGTRRVYHGARADVRTGNGAGVDLVVNGKKLGVMGAAGAVVERSLALNEE